MISATESVHERMTGKTITGVMFRQDCVVLHCEDDQTLRPFALNDHVLAAATQSAARRQDWSRRSRARKTVVWIEGAGTLI